MKANIYPLQEMSFSLLRELYIKKSLPITDAMSHALDYYYPPVESILKTLEHYKKEDLVTEFVKNNESLVLDAKNEVLKKQVKQAEESVGGDVDDIFGSFSGFQFNSFNAYDALKNVPLSQIEESLSNEISKLCDKKVSVEINSFSKSESIGLSAEMNIRIKSNFGS